MISNKIVPFGIGTLLFSLFLVLFGISCAEGKETLTEQAVDSGLEDTAVAPTTINETENANDMGTALASPTLEPSPSLNGEQILRNTIGVFDEVEEYRLEITITGSVGDGTVDCYVQPVTTLCEQNIVLPGGESDTSLLLQYNNSSWYKNNEDEEEWQLVGKGFKLGYAGLNDFTLIQTVNSAVEQNSEDGLIYEIIFDFEPEPLLGLILNDESAGQKFLPGATNTVTTGTILINPETMLPIQETVLIQIDSETKPLSLLTEIVYFWNESSEIELPLGEHLLQLADEFMTRISDDKLEDAYELFSVEAKNEFSRSDFDAFIRSNKVLFLNYKSSNLLGYEGLPETAVDVEGEYRMIIVEANYESKEPVNYMFIFSLDDSWKILRFDTITLTPSS